MSKIAIGIDFGTTYSSVAVYQNGEVRVISNLEGETLTPSEVAFTSVEKLVGRAAQSQKSRNPENTIFDIKRLIGRNFNDPELRADLKNLPFKVVSIASDLFIEVDYKDTLAKFTLEDIAAVVFEKMKTSAERYLGYEVNDAVITVPAYFNQAQREATKLAATIAGLTVIQTIEEPTAAAMAFGLERRKAKQEVILILDIGGGTFDVSILKVSPNKVYEVLSSVGDTHFGGSDFDQKLLDHFVEEFNKKHNVDITGNLRSMQRLRTACEFAKRSLSNSMEATVDVDALYDGIDFLSKITRARFEKICEDLFRRLLVPVKKAIDSAKINKTDIDEIVLVGGSSRIPKVQKLLKDFFDGKALNNSINPDEAVAYGAAVQAAILSGVRFNHVGKSLLRDLTPLSLGVKTIGDVMLNLIPRNTPIPAKQSVEASFIFDNQELLTIEVYEGERACAGNNHKIGDLELYSIKPLTGRKMKLVVTFAICKDGILTVSAEDQLTGIVDSVTITKRRLENTEISRMIEEAERYKDEDKLYRERVDARNKLEDYVSKVKSAEEISRLITKRINDALRIEMTWLERNINAEKDILDSRYERMEKACGSIITNLELAKMLSDVNL